MHNSGLPDSSDGRCLLALNDIRFHWPGRDGFALSVDSLRLDFGEKLFLKGPSGSGKSTLLSLICGIVSPDSGSIRIDGTDIARLGASRADRLRADKFGIIFQQFNLLPYGNMLQNVLLPLQFSSARRERVSAGGMPAEEARRLLQRLGLAPDQHARRVTRLSIGQQQRVAVARAMIGNPRLIIADEPTSALDSDNRDEFLKLLFEEVTRANAGLILVSHDQSLASRFDRRVDISEIASTTLPGTT
ncbi:MAG: ABC transporter ATP-binding protein [Proteobacteria bacterium]|nr:ABC transporter ATP-binding protein [Pseudomonadota bacterium]